MNLGDLEYKLEDFEGIDMSDERGTSRFGLLHFQAKRLADEANRLLRVKLEKSHRLYGIKDPLEVLLPFSAQRKENDTHMGRLVCLEELKKWS